MTSPPNQHPQQVYHSPTEMESHYTYLKGFRTDQCQLFSQHKCSQHRPFTCFNWHFRNQRRRRPLLKKDGTFNYSPDNYCPKYDETTGTCPDGDECPLLHRTSGDTERRYHLRYYKTCMCVYETDARGLCVKNGPHCAFAHGEADKRPPVFDINDPQNSDGGEELNLNGPNPLDKERNMMVDDPKWHDSNYVLLYYKTEQCRRPPRLCRQGYACPQYHNSRDRRRSPRTYKYRSTPCPNVKHGEEWGEPSQCDDGDSCPYCHTRTEQQFHPEIYKSTKCNDAWSITQYCPRGPFCAFAHDETEMSFNRNLASGTLADILSSALPSSSSSHPGSLTSSTPSSPTNQGGYCSGGGGVNSSSGLNNHHHNYTFSGTSPPGPPPPTNSGGQSQSIQHQLQQHQQAQALTNSTYESCLDIFTGMSLNNAFSGAGGSSSAVGPIGKGMSSGNMFDPAPSAPGHSIYEDGIQQQQLGQSPRVGGFPCGSPDNYNLGGGGGFNGRQGQGLPSSLDRVSSGMSPSSSVGSHFGLGNLNLGLGFGISNSSPRAGGGGGGGGRVQGHSSHGVQEDDIEFESGLMVGPGLLDTLMSYSSSSNNSSGGGGRGEETTPRVPPREPEPYTLFPEGGMQNGGTGAGRSYHQNQTKPNTSNNTKDSENNTNGFGIGLNVGSGCGGPGPTTTTADYLNWNNDSTLRSLQQQLVSSVYEGQTEIHYLCVSLLSDVCSTIKANLKDVDESLDEVKYKLGGQNHTG